MLTRVCIIIISLFFCFVCISVLYSIITRPRAGMFSVDIARDLGPFVTSANTARDLSGSRNALAARCHDMIVGLGVYEISVACPLGNVNSDIVWRAGGFFHSPITHAEGQRVI